MLLIFSSRRGPEALVCWAAFLRSAMGRRLPRQVAGPRGEGVQAAGVFGRLQADAVSVVGVVAAIEGASDSAASAASGGVGGQAARVSQWLMKHVCLYSAVSAQSERSTGETGAISAAASRRQHGRVAVRVHG